MKKKKSSGRFKLKKVIDEEILDRSCTCCPVNGEACHCGSNGGHALYYRIWDTKKKKLTRHRSSDLYGTILEKEEGMEKVRALNRN